MRLVHGCDDAVARFVARLIPICRERGFDICTAIGVANGDQLVGGFVFHDYSPEFGVIELSFAGIDKRWLTRLVLYGVFSYVFNDVGCQMACSRTPASFRQAIRITKAYGFRQATIPRLFGRNEDGIISTLTVEDWRANGFHKENANGQG
jgi:RimJ/RimL family protein N-acetyltransferase